MDLIWLTWNASQNSLSDNFPSCDTLRLEHMFSSKHKNQCEVYNLGFFGLYTMLSTLGWNSTLASLWSNEMWIIWIWLVFLLFLIGFWLKLTKLPRSWIIFLVIVLSLIDFYGHTWSKGTWLSYTHPPSQPPLGNGLKRMTWWTLNIEHRARAHLEPVRQIDNFEDLTDLLSTPQCGKLSIQVVYHDLSHTVAKNTKHNRKAHLGAVWRLQIKVERA